MRQSALFSATTRDVSSEETAVNAILLTKGGYVRKVSAGVYAYLPLGLRVIRKISDIVRRELDALPNTSEIQMTNLQPRELWQETGRWDDAGMREIMYRVGDEQAYGLGATHEEPVTDLFRQFFHSYRELPIATYQIATKFRGELRAKSGLMRGREFLMKDLYSFHLTPEDLDTYYEQVAAAYLRIYEAMGLKAIRTQASGGVFTTIPSDEFQVVTPVGEDTIYVNEAGDHALNEEVTTQEEAAARGYTRTEKATEVGNIFHLETKYTAAMKAEVATADGTRVAPVMGCYGLGISRVMGVLVELMGSLDQSAIRWPASVAPFRVHLIDLTKDRGAEAVYTVLREAGFEVLYDDRDLTAGAKFGDADLVGAPVRVVVSPRSLEAGGAEVVPDWTNSPDRKEVIALGELAARLA